MRTLYLDCFAGVSGDMMVGALIDCGLDFEALRQELTKLNLQGYELSLTRVDRSGISASKFDVRTTGHDLSHHHAHRSLSEIKQLIETSALSSEVKRRGVMIFERIGAVEAKIHDIPIEEVHFHEVGAVDSIIDIVGVCIGLEMLGLERILCSALHVGSGTFTCAHGTYPVPGPAAVELLRGVPIYSGEIVGELVTPTGAAIVAVLASDFGPLPAMRTERIGYGAGTRTYPNFPNVLRAIIGEMTTDRASTSVAIIETNIDDLNAQVFGYLMEQLLTASALDVFYTPVQMKKNRPGILLTVLCAPEDRERITEILFRETTTIGVRYRIEQREVLRRERVTVKTPYGEIGIKVAYGRDGQQVNFAPEFDDCRAAALRYQVAIREVQQAAITAFHACG